MLKFIKHLVLILSSICFTYSSFATKTCGQFLQNKSLSVIGSISVTDASDAVFLSYNDRVSVEPKMATQLLATLANHIESTSPTTLRVEEKAVIPTDKITEFLNSVEDKLNVKWRVRDEAPEGKRFLTVTGYTKSFEIPTSSKLSVVGKIRIRKYFEESESNPFEVRPVFDNLSTLEIKITNMSGLTTNGEVQVLENAVFKPRIFISDLQLKKLKVILNQKELNQENLDKLVEEIINLEKSDLTHPNEAEKVKSFIAALLMLQQSSKDLLEVEQVISYNRKAYSFITADNKEFQFTADQNVKVYNGDPKIFCCSLIEYVNQKPIEEIPEGLSYTEIKSPVSEKKDETLVYNTLYFTLLDYYTDKNFKLNQGKYGKALQNRRAIFEESQNTILKDYGVLLWMVRGTAYMPTPQIKKDLLERTNISLAIPFEAPNNKVYRAVLEYETYVTTRGTREAILKDIKVVDEYGSKIKMGSKELDQELRNFKNYEDSQLAGLIIHNQPILIKPKLTSDELTSYNKFFDLFYTSYSKSPSNPRAPEELQQMDSVQKLKWYKFKMNVVNKASYLWSRVHRVVVAAAITGAALYYFKYDNNRNLVVTEIINSQPQEVSTTIGPAASSTSNNIKIKMTPKNSLAEAYEIIKDKRVFTLDELKDLKPVIIDVK